MGNERFSGQHIELSAFRVALDRRIEMPSLEHLKPGT